MASLISGLQLICTMVSTSWYLCQSQCSQFWQEGSTEASLQRRHPNCACFGRQDHVIEVAEAVWIAIPWSGGGGVVTCSSMSQDSNEAERGSIRVDEVQSSGSCSRLIPPPDVFCRWPGLSGELKASLQYRHPNLASTCTSSGLSS